MSDYFDRVERQLVARVEASTARRSRLPVHLEHLAVAASLLVVFVVAAVFIGIRGSGSSGSPPPARAVRVVFSVSASDLGTPVTPGSIARSIGILRHRLDSVSSGVRVSGTGRQVVVFAPASAGIGRARIVALAAPARLVFYDWEANALTPNGQTVASLLRDQNPAALEISQGTGSGPGVLGAGSLPLYQAVRLASLQPAAPVSVHLSRLGAQYYLFGAPGSAACAAAASDAATTPIPGQHCLLAGPAATVHGLDSTLPAGVSASAGQRLVVPQGTVVLQAANLIARHPVTFDSPSAQFYVLHDSASLTGKDITNPQPGTNQANNPDVELGFTSSGRSKFEKVTAQTASRGLEVSSLGQTLDQHFAVAVDNQLVTVPSIDFKQYPDGIISSGADITDSFTTQTARDLAAQLRYGALPVTLTMR